MWGPIYRQELFELLPYGILVTGALFLLFTTKRSADQGRNGLAVFFAWFVTLAAMASLYFIGDIPRPFGMLIHDRTGFGFAQVVLFLLLLAIPATASRSALPPAKLNGLLSLLLLSATGGIWICFSNDLLSFFVGLELLSLPLYVATSLREDSRIASEAAFKYFLLGAVSSAVFIYGVALLWGGIGTVRIPQMAVALSTGQVASKELVMVGAALAVAGLAFKIGLVPFHMWVPDVYEGAPAWAVAWMSGAVKASIFAFAFRFFSQAVPARWMDWPFILNFLALVSMLWGSLAALYQANIKRMLAYSSISHAGYATLGLVAASEGMGQEASSALIYYLLTYGIASLVTFLVVSVEESEGHVAVADFRGLAKRKPGIALIFAIALLSLAGLPPLAGFVGKFNVFMLAVRGGHFLPVFIGVITSLISLGYYLNVIVAAYMREPADLRPFRVGKIQFVTLGSCAVVMFILGILPGKILEFFLSTASRIFP